MIKIDWNKLKALNEHVQYIDLTNPIPVKDGDHITVIQHFSSGGIVHSSSDCKVIKGEHLILATVLIHRLNVHIIIITL